MQLIEELITGNYSKESANNYARLASNLLYNHFSDGATLQKQKVDALYQKIMQEKQTVRRFEESNNPAFLVSDTAALIKQPKSTYEASHQRVIEHMEKNDLLIV